MDTEERLREVAELSGLPIMFGEAAELNRAERMLGGEYTEKDKELRLAVLRHPDIFRSHRIFDPNTPITYLGVQVWPPL